MSEMLDFISGLTIRARVTFFLVISEQIFRSKINSDDDDGYIYGLDAIRTAWRWTAGENISGCDVYLCFENERDVGVLTWGGEAETNGQDTKKASAWYALATGIAYTAFRGYIAEQQDEQDDLPQSLEVVKDSWVDMLFEYADEAGYADCDMVTKLKKYLLEHYACSDPEELGVAINRDELIAAIAK